MKSLVLKEMQYNAMKQNYGFFLLSCHQNGNRISTGFVEDCLRRLEFGFT